MYSKIHRLPRSVSVTNLGARWLAFGCLACLWTAPGLFGAGVDLFSAPPLSIESSNGVLNADLVVKYTNLTINGRDVHLRTYNGRIPGPTLRAHPGDTLNIRYINRLPTNAPMDTTTQPDGYIPPHEFNTINLHTHGLNVSPERNSDNVLLMIEPGYWVPFEVRIPTNHPTGLFWYHPHKHGSTSVQVGGGLAGNIILTGPGDLDQIPEIKAAKKLEMVLSEMQLQEIKTQAGSFEVPDEPAVISREYDTKIFTVNGIPMAEVINFAKRGGPPAIPDPIKINLPEIHIAPGEVQRWQVTHAGNDDFYDLIIAEGEDGPTVSDVPASAWPVHLIAYDAITLPAVDTTNRIFLASGNRAEVLVQGAAVGEYFLKSLVPISGTNTMRQVSLIKVIVAGTPKPMALPPNLNPPVTRLPDIKDSEIIRHRVISFDVTLAANGRQGLDFRANNRFFDVNRVDHTMLLNTAEEWTLTTDQFFAHPFHIHVNWFQVTHINGDKLPRPRWQDTVLIPNGGSVTIRHRFQQYTGKYVFHCHILTHEDVGMMAVVEVIDPQNLTPLQAWRQQQFLRPINQFEGADGADPDGDGIPNFLHYAFGTIPYFPSGLPHWSTISIGNQNYWTATFDRFNAPTSPTSGVKYMLQSSGDLNSWSELDLNTHLVGNPVDKGNGFETVTVRDDKPIAGPGADNVRFLRVGVTEAGLFEPLPITAGLPQ